MKIYIKNFDTSFPAFHMKSAGLLSYRSLVAFTLAISLVNLPNTSRADPVQTGSVIPVSVTVVANAKIQNHHQMTELNISQADIDRGYVDVAGALQFSVITNSRSGYLMEFNPIGNIFESVKVSGVGNEVKLDADGGNIVQRGLSYANLNHELSFRFTLNQDIKAGSYPWPLVLKVRALH